MKVKAPIINFEQEILLTTEIQQLRHQEYLTNKQKQLQSTLTHPPLILISGTITLLKIRNADFLWGTTIKSFSIGKTRIAVAA